MASSNAFNICIVFAWLLKLLTSKISRIVPYNKMYRSSHLFYLHKDNRIFFLRIMIYVKCSWMIFFQMQLLYYLQNCLLNLFIIIHEIRYILIYFESNEKHNFAEKIPTISITSIKKVNLLILINETVLSMEFSKSNFISVVINKSLGFERRELIHVWNTRCFLLVLFFNLR